MLAQFRKWTRRASRHRRRLRSPIPSLRCSALRDLMLAYTRHGLETFSDRGGVPHGGEFDRSRTVGDQQGHRDLDGVRRW